MFNRSQINRLKELSLQVLGNENAFTKLLKDKQFQVLASVKEVEESFYYDYIPVKNSKNGRVTQHAVKKFYPKDKPFPKKQIPVYREMTFDELESALIAASEMKGFQALNEIDIRSTKEGTESSLLYETLVAKYKDGTIINKPFLHVTEADRPEFETSFEMLPEDQKSVLKQYVVPNAPKNGSFVVDGLKFLYELVYHNTHQDKPEEQ